MIFASFEKNPIPQILALPTPKKQKTGIKCIDALITTTNFHQFSRDELDSFFSLLSNGQTLEILKNEYDIKSEIIIPSLSPLITENVEINDPNIKSIVSFFILRCSITFMSQNASAITSSSLKKMLQLLVFSIDNNNNSNLTNLSKQIFLIILSSFIEKVNPDMLEILKHFFNIVDGYYDESLIVLVSMTKRLLDQINPTVDSFLLDYSSQYIFKSTNFNDVKNTLKDSIFPLLNNFDKKAIAFISKIISKLNFTELENFFKKVPENLLNYQSKPFLTPPNLIHTDVEIFTCDIEKVHSAQLLPFIKIESFESSYQIDFTIPRFIIDDYFPSDLTKLLLNLRNIVEKMPEANKLLSQLFINLIKAEDKKTTTENISENKLFDIAIMSLFVCNDDYLNLIILQSKIFAPNISTYEYKQIKDTDNEKRKEYELIFNTRTICLQQMRNLFSIIFPFLFSFYQYPLFVGDIFAFLIEDHIPNLAEMTRQNRDLLLEQIYRICGDYQYIQIRKLTNQDKISYSRVEILFYILKLLKKEENSQLLINNALFMQLIVSFMCEEKLRPIVLQTIEEVCTKREYDLSNCFSDFIKFIIIYNDDNKIRYDTLTSLNKIVSSIPDYKEYFDELVDPLIDSLNSISKNSNESDSNSFSLIYMKSIFKFVSLASIDSSISSTKKILTAIQQIEGDDPSDETFDTLLNTITGNNRKYKFQYNEETKNFEFEEISIKYPSVLGAFLKAFQKSSKFIGILQMLKESCSRSRENAIKCHEGQIDLLLIDIVKEFIEKDKKVNSKDKDENTIINGLQLFSSIALISSSVEVVQNFFSLFNEVDHQMISIYQSIFYIILNDLISIKDSFDEYLPLSNNSPVVQIHGINNINVYSGFSIHLWAYLSDMKNSSPKFFSIADDKRNKIELFGENKVLKIKISKNDEIINLINSDIDDFDYNDWNQIIISFIHIENKFLMSFSIRTTIKSASKIYPFEQPFDLDKNNLNIIFGGSNPLVPNGSDCSAIRLIGIYQLLDENESVDLFKGKTSQTIVNKTIATINFLNKDNHLVLESNFPLQKINAKLVGPTVFIPNSFKNVLINNDMLLMVFPLLLQSNCVLTDGRKTPDFCRILYMILFNVLQSSLKAQILFYKSNGVECLTHILTNDQSISFSNYQSILQLFKKIKLLQLRMEIMGKILLNMNIWIHSDALSQLQIYRDWSRTLNTKLNDYTNRFINFGTLLRDLRTFYWFSPIEKNIIYLNRKEDLNSKIVDIRSSILQILHTIAQKPDLFGYNELSLLISHITSCKDIKQVLSLLSFIRLIIVSPETTLRNIDNLWPQIARLHSLLLSQSMIKRKPLLQVHIADNNKKKEIEEDEDDDNSSIESVFLAVIDIFVTLHFLKIIEYPEVNIHVSIIIDILPIKNITHQFFVKFFPFAMKYPEVTPLLFFLGMKMSEKEHKIIVNKVNPDVKFSSTKYWDLYAILFGLKYGGENLDFISKFLAYSMHDKWDQAYQTITLIGFIFDIDTDEFKSKFLCLVCKNIMETPSLFYFETLHNFFDVALLHIFFRKANEMNSSLNALFMNSPFASKDIEKVEKPTSSMEVSKTIFFEKLIKDSEKIQEPSCFQSVFGLRFDKEGHWLDHDLAIELIKLSLKTKVQTFHNSSSILLAFLLREYPDDSTIKNYIDQLISKRAVDKPFLDFLNSIYQSETFSKKNYFECFEILLHDRLSINNSILNGISNLAKNLEQLHLNMKEETIEINKLCSNKKENDQELDEMQNHLIQNYSTVKSYTKEYQSNEDLVKTVTKNQSYLINKRENSDEIRKNFFNEIDCLVKYKEIKVSNKNNENHILNLILNPIENSYLMHQRGAHPLKKDKSVMLLTTPSRIKYNSQYYDDSTTIGKINENSNDTHSNIICVNALYYPQNNPVHSIKVKFTVSGSKVVISNKKSIHSNISNSKLVFKELDANDIKKMIFMPYRNMPIGIEIITNHPKKVYYITLLSNDALSILKKIASYKEFKDVFIQTQLPNFFFKSLQITKLWKEGKMSNFEYLMKLNRYSGRTFCNADSYPIFPRLECASNDSSGEENSSNTKPRDLKEPLNPNAPISDSFGVISLLKQRLPFKKEFSYCNNNNNNSSTPLRSPRISPRSAITFATFSSSNNNSNTSNGNMNSSSGNLSISNDSIINSNNSLNLDSCLSELTPEFFYDLKFFKVSKGQTKKDEDENRASFELIYNRRKLLESLDIADFIDLVWGVRRKAYNDDVHNFLPYQLFRHYHPKKTQGISEVTSPKKSIISYRDEFHSPIFVANEMCSVVDISNDDKKMKNYIYSFVCVERKSNTIYRVDVDIERRSIWSKETWSKLQGNVFTCMKTNPSRQSSNLFSFKSIFASQSTSQNNEKPTKDDEIPIEIDSNNNSSRVLHEDDSQADPTTSKSDASTSNTTDSLLTIISAFSSSQSSQMMNMNDSLKKFTYRTAQTSSIDSKIVNGIELMACDKEILATAGKMGSVISVYKDFQFVKMVPTFRDKITAIDVSSSFGLVAATTADGFLVLLDASCSNKSQTTSQKSVDLHSINEKHRNSSRHEIEGTDQISSEKDHSQLDFSSLHAYSPKLVLITKKWGFVVVYSEIDESIEKDDQNSHKIKRHRSKLSPGSFTALSKFFTHDDNKKGDNKNNKSSKRFCNDEDTAVGVIDVFTSSGDFIRREFVNSSIRCWTSFSDYQDFDYIAAADEDGKIFVFEVFYAMIGKSIANLRGKEIDFLFVEIPYSNVFAFSNNGDVDIIPIQK